MAKPQVKLYLDIVSPFAYIGFYALKNFPIFKQCDVTFVPILLGGIMNETNNAAPLTIKNKGRYIMKERELWAERFNIPMGPTPTVFPVRTLGVQRALTALTLSPHADKLADVIAALYQDFWVETKPIVTPEEFGPAFARVLGEDAAKAVIARSNDKEVKDLLIQRTSTAVEEGAFGVPYFVATNAKGETETFWGVSHLGLVVEHLGLERPAGAGWRSLL